MRTRRQQRGGAGAPDGLSEYQINQLLQLHPGKSRVWVRNWFRDRRAGRVPPLVVHPSGPGRAPLPAGGAGRGPYVAGDEELARMMAEEVEQQDPNVGGNAAFAAALAEAEGPQGPNVRRNAGIAAALAREREAPNVGGNAAFAAALAAEAGPQGPNVRRNAEIAQLLEREARGPTDEEISRVMGENDININAARALLVQRAAAAAPEPGVRRGAAAAAAAAAAPEPGVRRGAAAAPPAAAVHNRPSLLGSLAAPVVSAARWVASMCSARPSSTACPAGRSIPEVIRAANRGELRCLLCEQEHVDEARDLYRFSHEHRHTDAQLICLDHIERHILVHTRPGDARNYNSNCFCGGTIHPCELGALRVRHCDLYAMYVRAHFPGLRGGATRRKKPSRRKVTRYRRSRA